MDDAAQHGKGRRGAAARRAGGLADAPPAADKLRGEDRFMADTLSPARAAP
jgi:hypothetical protein